MKCCWWSLALLGVICLVADANTSSAAEKNETARQRVERKEVLVIGHRGDSKAAPENTLPAFASAVKAGADLVELDYYHSADGVPVVIHDSDLDRTTNAIGLWGGSKIPVTSKTVAELAKLDAGAWFGAKFAGTRVPTLVQAFDTIQPGSMTLIERKGGDPATCIELLQKQNLLDRVVVQAFDWEYVAGCHALAPDLVLAALGNKELTGEKLDQIAKTGAKIVAWEDKNTNPGTIAAIHARGWKAWVWTVDNPARVAQLVSAKIDGIITNVPAKTRAAIQSARVSR